MDAYQLDKSESSSLQKEEDYLETFFEKKELRYTIYDFPPLCEIKSLTLYYRATCPFCKYVLHFLQLQGKSVTLKNIEDPSFLQELIEIGGKGQVPCLVANDRYAMYESRDIVAWVDQNFDLLNKQN